MKGNVLLFISLCVVGCVMTYAQQMPGLLQKGKADTQDCKAWVDEQLSIMVQIGRIPLKDRRYRYSCLNFMLLKEMVENISKMPMNLF